MLCWLGGGARLPASGRAWLLPSSRSLVPSAASSPVSGRPSGPRPSCPSLASCGLQVQRSGALAVNSLLPFELLALGSLCGALRCASGSAVLGSVRSCPWRLRSSCPSASASSSLASLLACSCSSCSLPSELPQLSRRPRSCSQLLSGLCCWWASDWSCASACLLGRWC